MTPQRLSIALAVSLGLNLFVGGFVVARMVIRSRHEPREPFTHDSKPIRDARQKVVHALERQPPDKIELEAAFGELRNATTATQIQMHQHLIDLAPKLTAEQRAKLIRRWAKGPRRGRALRHPAHDHAFPPP